MKKLALLIAATASLTCLGACSTAPAQSAQATAEANYLMACATADKAVETATVLIKAGKLSQAQALAAKPFVDQLPTICPGSGAIPADPVGYEAKALQLVNNLSTATQGAVQ